MKKKYSELEMPKQDMMMDEEDSMMDELDLSDEELDEDSEEGLSDLSAISDEDLMSELKARGLMGSDEEEDEDLDL